ncbi:BQ5605_C005g03562 [Microbotryum silenes-dioicae]|uniref:BQ5605_C005g03562 protein n=1 Tax=Microbotryum silenes-dioicae TaxID=796604 RepID=A0A2X0MB93_9BASI|nr:BQ5605_C005g03562 [Microbotryum silenes-dioicae]
MAVSATFFDRKEVQIQDDVVVYADALDKPLRKAQSHGQRPATSAATLDGPASTPSDSSTTEGNDADARTRAQLARGSSSRLLGEPDRQAWAAKTNLLSKASRRRFVEQVMECQGVFSNNLFKPDADCRMEALEASGLAQGQDRRGPPTKDILSPRQRPVLVFLGEGGSSRGTQKATYRTNVLCRDLVQEFNRLQERGFVVEIVSVDEYKISSVCSDPPAATR